MRTLIQLNAAAAKRIIIERLAELPVGSERHLMRKVTAMSDRNDDQYYARRETQQRALAAKAMVPEIRQIHLDLAEGYARQVGSVRMERARPTLRIVNPN